MPPVFEYECPNCGVKIEDLNSQAKIRCDCLGPKDSPHFKRVYSLGGVHFKGKGFYKTD